jgi:predicted helicase
LNKTESLNEPESTSFKFSEPESTPFKGSNSQNLGVSITKTDIFHYIYAVLHSPDYRTKYEINLKQDFPRIPFYDDFSKYADLGRELMNLHLGKFEPQNLLQIVEIPQTENQQKFVPNTVILKMNKNKEIVLDNLTKIVGISNKALEYKLGNRSAIEWILDQYKPKKETENDEFDNYNWTKLKPQVIDLLQKVHRISLKTQEIVLELK